MPHPQPGDSRRRRRVSRCSSTATASPPAHCLAVHAARAAPHRYLSGGKVLLGARVSAALDEAAVLRGDARPRRPRGGSASSRSAPPGGQPHARPARPARPQRPPPARLARRERLDLRRATRAPSAASTSASPMATRTPTSASACCWPASSAARCATPRPSTISTTRARGPSAEVIAANKALYDANRAARVVVDAVRTRSRTTDEHGPAHPA